MPSLKSLLSGAAVLAISTQVAAHGYVQNIKIDGKDYPGLNPASAPYQTPAPVSVGWTEKATDLGFVAPSSYTSSDIICHKQATPGQTHAPVAAGGIVRLSWNTWPESHHGPVLNYMANCNGPCESVDPSSLSFFKIAADGLVSGSNPGSWATDTLIASNFSQDVTIPSSIAPGNYVLRHEIIALHSAGNADGAQNYPQCVNLEVSGSGSVTPKGVPATELYTPTDPGIQFNLYTSFDSYPEPGPAVFDGSSSSSSGGNAGGNSSSSSAAASSTAASSAASSASLSASTTVSTAAAVLTPSPPPSSASASPSLPLESLSSILSALPTATGSGSAPLPTGSGSGSPIPVDGLSVPQLLDLLREILERLVQMQAAGKVGRRHARDVVRRM